MRCSKCGGDNAAGKKFCGDCGAPLTNSCPQCGVDNPPGKRFCGDCGTALAAWKATIDSSPLSPISPGIAISIEQTVSDVANGERKTVTALFADIKGSMELMEDLDPEEARAIVDPALKLMIEAVRRYGGYVVQSTGDGIFALFGAPLPMKIIRNARSMRLCGCRMRCAASPSGCVRKKGSVSKSASAPTLEMW
jgi:Double zinc ribbon/Adenylate and Guanylate cyclase catalytic domain